MPYSIPDDEEIRDALRRVLKRMKGINSLRKLREIVLNDLKRQDPDYTVSPERLRKIAVKSSFVNIRIEVRREEKKDNLKGKCPVCGAKLKMTKNETIFGGSVTVGYNCEECPYWTTLKRRVPTRYRFEYKKEHDG